MYELIHGILGVSEKGSTKMIPIRERSQKAYAQALDKRLLRGTAWEQKHKILLMEFSAEANALWTQLGACWRTGEGIIKAVCFSKAHFQLLSTWYLYALVEGLLKFEEDKEPIGKLIEVINGVPEVLGGQWIELSPPRGYVGWIKFNPSMIAMKQSKEALSKKIRSVNDEVIMQMRMSGISETFIADFIHLREQKLKEA